MRFGIGGERFRLRAGPVAVTFGAPPPVATRFALVTLGGLVLVSDGKAIGLEVADE